MIEKHEFRIYEDYYPLVTYPNNAKFNGSVYVLNVLKDDLLFGQIGMLYERLMKENRGFFSSWQVHRSYSKKELAAAELFHITIKAAFEPAGEECGTVYDETNMCEICGENRIQISRLKLKKSSIPRKDIARTIAGEVIVSERFVNVFKEKALKGMRFEPVIFGSGTGNYHQLISSSPALELTEKIDVGYHPFDKVAEDVDEYEFFVSGGYKIKVEKQIFKCPKGHTIGPSILSEPYVYSSADIFNYDFFVSRQKVGIKQGWLNPEPLYFCSPAFKKMIEDEKLNGFVFEIAHIQ